MAKENYFSKKMTTKTDDELREYINNKSQFQEKAVLAAIWELERREKGGEEIKELENQILYKKKEKPPEFFKKERNYTDDPNAPLLFPKWSIWVSSLLFAPLFGGTLMAMNFNQTKQKEELGQVLGFSVLFSIVVIYVANMINDTSNVNQSITYFTNIVATLIFDQYFWNKKLGKNLKYRKRSVLIPFMIFAGITGFLIWSMIATENI